MEIEEINGLLDEPLADEDKQYEAWRDAHDADDDAGCYTQMKEEIQGLQGVLRDNKQKLELKDEKIKRLEAESKSLRDDLITKVERISELENDLDEAPSPRARGIGF